MWCCNQGFSSTCGVCLPLRVRLVSRGASRALQGGAAGTLCTGYIDCRYSRFPQSVSILLLQRSREPLPPLPSDGEGPRLRPSVLKLSRHFSSLITIDRLFSVFHFAFFVRVSVVSDGFFVGRTLRRLQCVHFCAFYWCSQLQ